MPPWLVSEYGLWLLGVVAALVAVVASRLEVRRASALAGWLAFGALAAGALVWMFRDTYAYHFTEKERQLRVSYWGSYREHEMWEAIVKAFQEQHPDIPVKREYLTGQYEDMIQRLLLADDAPDVMLFQDEPFPRFISSGKFEPLDAWCKTPGQELDLDRDYWDTAVQSFRSAGVTYGIPIWGGMCMVIYNRATFAEAGVAEPPEQWTVEEFLDTCQRLTADVNGDGRIDRYGFVDPDWIYWLPFHYAFGADYLDATRTRWTLWGPEALASYTFWQDLRHRYHVAPRRGELTESGGTAFMTGRCGMFVSGPWAMPPLNAAEVDYDVAHIPRGSGGHATRVTWDALMMFAGSKKKDWAWTFTRFATSLPAQEIVAAYQRSVPALKAAKDAFIRGNPRVRNRRFIEAFAYSRIQPISLHWQAMGREIASATDPMRDNKQTPEKTLRALATNPRLRECFTMPEVENP